MSAMNPLSIGAASNVANNACGIEPRDMIAILQAIKAAGAIQVDIGSEVM